MKKRIISMFVAASLMFNISTCFTVLSESSNGSQINFDSRNMHIQNASEEDIIDFFEDENVGDYLPMNTARLVSFGNLSVNDLTLITEVFLKKLPMLRTIVFYRSQIEDFSALNELTNLIHLEFDNTEISDLAQINELDIVSLQFYETCVPDLSPLIEITSLEELTISSGKGITMKQVKAFKLARPDCQVFSSLKGYVLNNDEVGILDAVAVLQGFARVPGSPVMKCEFAREASLITAQAQAEGMPGILDAVEVLKYFAKVPGNLIEKSQMQSQ